MTDQDTTQEQPQEQPPDTSRRLLRTRNNRVIAGVAGGLGKYFRIDPVIVRIGFAISVFFGGLGAIAYIALALFVPTAPGPDGEVEPAPIERSRWLAVGVGIAAVLVALSWGIWDGPWGDGFFFGPFLFFGALVAGAILIARWAAGGSRGGGALATILLAVGAFIVLSMVALAAAWAAATGHGLAVAIAVVAIGVMLIVAAFNGGARWLIAPAIALAIPLGAVSAADISFGDGIGERTYRPLTTEALPEEGYQLGIGRLVVDLRDLDWTDDTVVDLDVDLGIGQAVVAVPSDVCVTTDFDAKAGDLRVAGDHNDGIDAHSAVNEGATATPRLNLTGEVDLGQLRVINDDDADLDDHGDWRWNGDENGDEMSAALGAACTTPPPPAKGDGKG